MARRKLGQRSALGATRGRLLAQMLAESLIPIASAGAADGVRIEGETLRACSGLAAERHIIVEVEPVEPGGDVLPIRRVLLVDLVVEPAALNR